MKDKEAALKRRWQRILKTRNRNFVHFTCRGCGTHAHAASLEIADLFGGWTKLKRQKPLHYTGLCIECSDPPTPSKKRRKR